MLNNQTIKQKQVFVYWILKCGIYLVIVSWLLVISIGNTPFAKEPEKFTYESRGRRDPFVPLVSQEVRISAAGLESVEGPDDIILEGIVWDSYGDSIAVLNGVIMKEGQQVASVKIKKIEKKSVVLLINEIEHKIPLIKKGEAPGEEF